MPVNAPALARAIREHEAGGPEVIVWWAEGNKTRLALERLAQHPHAVERAKALGAIIVVLAWVGGEPGAKLTNCVLSPKAGLDPDFTIRTINDKAIDLDACLLHVFFRDNDTAGYTETSILARRFEHEYLVDPQKLRIVQPPIGVVEHWDDADPLPRKYTEERRIDQIFDTQPASELVLLMDGKKPYSNSHNALVLISSDPVLKELFRFNQMTLYDDIMGPIPGVPPHDHYPRSLEDCDDIDVMNWLQARGLCKITKNTVRDAVRAHARQHQYHPILDYYDSLEWDGVPRIDKSFTTYFGMPKSPYAELAGKYWWMQTVARIYKPGCQADYVLVLVGEQGMEKTKALKTIFGEYYGNNLKSILDQRKAGEHVRGKQCLEIGEGKAFNEAGIDATKDYITSAVDEYQEPYGHKNVKHPRQCIFVITINEMKFLKDPTGDRRYWAIVCLMVDIDGLQRDRDQLFAEAVYRFKQGERYWPTKEEERLYFKPQQDEHTREEGWQVLIEEALDYFNNYVGVCFKMGAILQFLADRHRGGKAAVKTADIGSFLRKLGWESGEPIINGKRGRWWFRVSERDIFIRDEAGRPKAEEKKTQALPQPIRWTGGATGQWTTAKTAAEEAAEMYERGVKAGAARAAAAGDDAAEDEPAVEDEEADPVPF